MTTLPDPAAAPAAPILLREQQDGIVTLTLNTPARRNALTTALLSELREAIASVHGDAAVRALILAANGPVFSSGHDMKEMVGASQADAAELFGLCSEVMTSLRRLPQPAIARVHALASAAGAQLVASCDLVVAAETAAFQTPGVMIGLFCSTPMVPVSRALPDKKVLEMLFTGRPMGAREAERLGFVNRVVPPERLDEETLALVHDIIQYSAYTLAVGKQAFYRQRPLPEHDAYAIACDAMTRNVVAPDAQEGMTAFLEKRPPRWE